MKKFTKISESQLTDVKGGGFFSSLHDAIFGITAHAPATPGHHRKIK